MQGRERTAAARRRVAPGLEVYVVEIGVARSTRQEVELPRVGRDDRVPLEAPVRRRRDRIEAERLIRGRHA